MCVQLLLILSVVSYHVVEGLQIFQDQFKIPAVPNALGQRYHVETHKGSLGLNKLRKLISLPLQHDQCGRSFLTQLETVVDASASDTGALDAHADGSSKTLTCAGLTASYAPELKGWLVTDKQFFPKLFGHASNKLIAKELEISFTPMEGSSFFISVPNDRDGVVFSTDAMVFFVLRLDLIVHVSFRMTNNKHSRNEYELICVREACRNIRTTVDYLLHEDYASQFHTSLSKLIEGYNDESSQPSSVLDRHFVNSRRSDVSAMETDARICLLKGL